MKKNISLLLIFLVVAGAILRFYNLNWGAPFYFHPDERNIASSVSQIKYPDQLNPNFFAYGSLPIYSIYLVGVINNFLLQLVLKNSQLASEIVSIYNVNFSQAIVISRFFSATYSLLLIPIMFFLGKKLKNTATGSLAAIVTTTSTGLIQFAHFGTFELWLTFFTVILFWFSLKVLETQKVKYIIALGITFGILLSTKVSHLALLPIPILVLHKHNRLFRKFFPWPHSQHMHLSEEQTNKITHRKKPIINLNLLQKIILLLAAACIIYRITNPFVFLDEHAFKNSMDYESRVALGTLPVFYTGEFMNATPVLFQFLHIYPFLINPLMTILFIPSFFYVLFISIKHKNKPYLILITFFVILFASQAFLYAKWTRYMMPTLPFIYLICAIALVDFYKLRTFYSSSDPAQRGKSRNLASFPSWLLAILLTMNTIFALSYFITAFVQTDTRIAAKNFAKLYIPASAPIISEVYDLGITPFNDSFSNITLFNFYEMDNNSFEFTPASLDEKLSVSDYIILPSQRIMKTRLQDPANFPNEYAFYSRLFNNLKGFQKIYETPCDLFCRITYLNSPVWSFEGTATVFDRPTVYIFKKNLTY